jgi:N-acetylmuramoyl-L-alanine amidase
MVNILLKYLSLVLVTFLLPLQAAQARDWGITVPSWISNLTEEISERVEALSNRDYDHNRQVTCVALAVYYESRGESVRGQRAVASVVMNRVRSPRFPNSACKVVFQKGQFAFTGPRLQPRGAQWDSAIRIADEFAASTQAEVPHLFFHNPSGSRLKRSGLLIGNHVFY